MRTVSYKCDVCREDIKDLSNLRTIYWKSDIIPQRYILQDVRINDPLDKQICLDCIKMIKDFKIDG